MRYKLTFAVGFAAGYVLGTKAGTERYQQIENAWRRFVDTPAVQEAAGVVGAQASRAFDQAKTTVTNKVNETVSATLHHDGHGRHASHSDGHASGHASRHESSNLPPAYAEREFGSQP